MNANIGFVHFLNNLDFVGMTIIAILSVMSLTVWYVIFIKAIKCFGQKSKSDNFLKIFWHSASSNHINKAIHEASKNEPFGRVAGHASESAKHFESFMVKQEQSAEAYNDFLTRSIRYAIDEERTKLESGMTALATVASTAPFIGLFGTVWGIYHALVAIGISGQGTLDKVAGPVGEALIMTACGLGVAIPAVLGYNAFSRLNKKTLHKIDGFAYSLYSFLATGGHPSGTRA